MPQTGIGPSLQQTVDIITCKIAVYVWEPANMIERILHILSLILKTTLQGRHNRHFTDEEMRLGEDFLKAMKLVGWGKSEIGNTLLPLIFLVP